MSKMNRFVLSIPMVFILVLIMAALPLLLQPDGSHSIRLDWPQSAASMKDYVSGIATGESFRFLSGQNTLSFWEQVGSYFSISFGYLACGALIGTTIGVLIGVYFSLSRAEWLKRIVEFSGAMPDFVSILLLQFLVVFVASKTGVVLFQIATLSVKEPAVVLPLASSILIPASYMIRNVTMQMTYTLAEDYIGFAKARGLRKLYIVFYHALPNVLPFIRADLHKFLGILIGNIFIVEYLYNLHGLTMLLFSNVYSSGGYQFPLVVNGLLSLLVLYAVIYALLKTYLWGWEKVLSR
ncbi:peptide/nickel transport system permease protein [Paenibacillus sp. RU4T]|nr:peptide/nickel transport system permease protein [Paenibacillus sp. RU4X]SIQ59542.1 peptide/nickel transport system permease protein [Paenibacillus sp. RU4T]